MAQTDWIVLPLDSEASLVMLNDLFERGWYLNDEDLVLSVDRRCLSPHGRLILSERRGRHSGASLIVLTNAGTTCRQRAVAVPRDERGRSDYATVLEQNAGWDMLLGLRVGPTLHVAILQKVRGADS